MNEVDQTGIELGEVRVGQVWKDKLRKPESVYLVTGVWTKQYPGRNGKTEGSRDRVTGVLSSGHGVVDAARSMDVDSLRKMFPYLLFDPPGV